MNLFGFHFTKSPWNEIVKLVSILYQLRSNKLTQYRLGWIICFRTYQLKGWGCRTRGQFKTTPPRIPIRNPHCDLIPAAESEI